MESKSSATLMCLPQDDARHIGSSRQSSMRGLKIHRTRSTSSVSTYSGTPSEQAVFRRLPREIIEQILYSADPNTFASLILLNRHWHQTAQLACLFAYQLSRCPSSTDTDHHVLDNHEQSDLPRLRLRFASEIKRNLFEVLLRPRRTTVRLVSTSANSYASFPGGEAFHFDFSPNGCLVLAYGSSRVYLLDLSSKSIAVKRELRVLRRPAATVILDDASKMAVLSSDHEVHVYDLQTPRARLIRSVVLDNPPRSVALSPQGAVLAVAYDGGIEVYPLSHDTVAVGKRVVKCSAVDSLTFSPDGTMLLGSTSTSNSTCPNTITLSAPYHNETGRDIPPSEILSRIWTTEILFPNASRDVSHAALLPQSGEGETSWIFVYDLPQALLRIVRLDDLKDGKWTSTGHSTGDRAGVEMAKTLPSVTHAGELVAVAFAGRVIRIYGIPRDLDSPTDITAVNGLIDHEGGWLPLQQDSRGRRMQEGARTHVMTSGLDNQPSIATPALLRPTRSRSGNPLIPSCTIGQCLGISTICWAQPNKFRTGSKRTWERLVVAAPGGIEGVSPGDEAGSQPGDGGRLIIYDFEAGPCNGRTDEITIEVGQAQAELLEEEYREMEAEVALVRRRTGSRDSSGSGRSLARGGYFTNERGHSTRRMASLSNDEPTTSGALFLPGPATTEAARRSLATFSSIPDVLTLEEAQEALDGPYSHSDPRSRTTLHRAATSAANSRRSDLPQRSRMGEARPVVPPVPVLPLTSQGLRGTPPGEIPHESDADNWVPPPPPYVPDAVRPLPEDLRRTLLPRVAAARPVSSNEPPRAPRGASRFTRDALQRTRSTFERATISLRGRRSDGRLRSGSDAAPFVSPVSTEHSSARQPMPSQTNVPWNPHSSVHEQPFSGTLPSLPPTSRVTSDSQRSAFSTLRYERSAAPDTLQAELVSPDAARAESSHLPRLVHQCAVEGDDTSRNEEQQGSRPTTDRISPSSPQLVLLTNGPRPDQLAALNSRTSRPVDLGNNNRGRPRSTVGHPRSSSTTPRGAHGAAQSPRHSRSLESLRSSTSASSRRKRRLNKPATTLSPPDVSRPDLHRLDTIHSVISQHLTPSLTREPSQRKSVTERHNSTDSKARRLDGANMRQATLGKRIDVSPRRRIWRGSGNSPTPREPSTATRLGSLIDDDGLSTSKRDARCMMM